MKKDKPFYLREPWEILFKDSKLDKTSPWSINLVYILTSLLEEMNRVGIDFRLAGTAINSSVLIYLKKAEMLLKLEDPPQLPVEKSDVYVPPPLSLPYRFQFTTTGIGDLIEALEKALTDERRKLGDPKTPVLPMPIPDFLDLEQYLLEIENRSEDLLERIYQICVDTISIFDLIDERNSLQIVRVFMMLLFLAQRDRIDLYQDEDEIDITISVKEKDVNE
jgi:chromatin segregation and condensation protein Rec8/ScpA/Scc1 (kleisin family)